MKCWTMHFGLGAALALIAGASPATAQDHDVIINGAVVSDQVSLPAPETYVGDMSAQAAGCSGCTSGGCAAGAGCGSATCGGGSCGGSCGSNSGSCGAACGNGGACGDARGNGAGGEFMAFLRGYLRPEAGGVCRDRVYGQPDLFYNNYTGGNCNRANAQMYLSPLPVPPNVGHTFYTYQPFYPEEMLYWHTNRFHNYYDNGRGLNRTRAMYYAPPLRTAIKNLYWNKIRLPR